MIGSGVSLVQTAMRPKPQLSFEFLSENLPPWIAFSRGSEASRFDASGALTIAAQDVPRITHDPSTGALRGLLIEDTTGNLLTHARTDLANGWSEGGTSSTSLALAALGQFDGVSVATEGAGWARLLHSAQPAVTSGTLYSFTLLYRSGTSGRIRGIFRSSAGDETRFAGEIGDSIGVSSSAAGGMTIDDDTLLFDGVTRKLSLSFTPSFTGTLSIGIGPDSATVGETIILLGAQLEEGAETSLILSDGTPGTRTADSVALTGLADSYDITARYGDDTSESFLAQSVAEGYWPPLSQNTLKSLTLKAV
ncbi:phage head spike fiber domain-containing protein [Celeribacter sp. ULVN23_4]